MKRPRLGKLFRWKYLLPRLAIVLVVCLAVRFCLDGVLRWGVIASAESSLGAKVEIANLETKLREGCLTMQGLAATNPSKPMSNLAEAGEANFEIDTTALLHKRLVITDGAITGLEFATARETSGAIEQSEEVEASTGPSALDPVLDAAGNYGAAWAENLSKRFESDLEDQLKTPKVVRELEARWPQEYAALEARVKALQVRAKEIEASFKEVKSNPLRNLQRLEQLQAELLATDREVRSLTAQINALPKQAKSDRQRLDEARRHDEAFARKLLKFDELDGDQLSAYLLEEETSGYMATAVDWIKWVRQLMPAKTDEPTRSRGVNVHFVDRLRPNWLVERVRLEGAASVGGESLALRGQLTGASSHPQLYEEPARLSLTGSGAVACNLEMIVDRRGEQAIDMLTFNCPQLVVPARTLGKADKLAVEVAGGPGRLEGELTLIGDALRGQLQWQQQNVQVAASIHKIKDERLQVALNETLKSLDRFGLEVKITGTLQKPKWKLQSDFGPQLARSFKTTMTAYMQQRTDQLLAGVQQKVDAQVAKLADKRAEAQQKLLAKLGENNKLLEQLAALTGGGGQGGRISLPQLGKLPFGNFRK